MENIIRSWQFLEGLFKGFFYHKIIVIDLSRNKKFRVGDFYDYSLGSVGLREPRIFFLALPRLSRGKTLQKSCTRLTKINRD